MEIYPVRGIHGVRYHGVSRGVQVDAHAARNFFDIHKAYDLTAFCPDGSLQVAARLLSVADLFLRISFVLVPARNNTESAQTGTKYSLHLKTHTGQRQVHPHLLNIASDVLGP